MIEVAVIGAPHELLGEAIQAFVVKAHEAALTPHDVEAHCRQRLPAFKTPKQIVLSAELPKTERGKLDRKALVERWNRGTAPT